MIKVQKTLIKLSKKQSKIIETSGYQLISGGPGSGKTTVAILKAEQIVLSHLEPSQKVLFLSFARPTVARVLEAIDEISNLHSVNKKLIEVETYHSFFWSIIKTHGYLIGLPRSLSVLTPSSEAVALAPLRNKYGKDSDLSEHKLAEKKNVVQKERHRLAIEEGRVCFDLFAEFTNTIIQNSQKIRSLINSKHPVIMLDEFQDTNLGQWNVVKELGKGSTLIALADSEQRIYDFIGADPERLNHFREAFSPTEFDLQSDNFRSTGTDIAQFGNHILHGKFKNEPYKGIQLLCFKSVQELAYSAMKGQALKARKRLIESEIKDWSLAVLVPTKKMMRLSSDFLRETQPKMPSVSHTASIDMEGAILAGEVIAYLLQPRATLADFKTFIEHVCNFYEGKAGDKPTKGNLKEAENIRNAFYKAIENKRTGKHIPKNSILRPLLATYKQCANVKLNGDPEEDWKKLRSILEESPCKRLQSIALEAKNIRLLSQGDRLRNVLSEDWRQNGDYINALKIVRNAFLQEHFSTSNKAETGIIVMNMHKSKGKQFDEVIIFEGWPNIVRGQVVANPDRIVRGNSKDQDLGQARQNMRVSVTRAKSLTTILTPKNDPCVLLIRN